MECVDSEVLQEYVVQKPEFHTRTLERVQGLSAGMCGKFDTRVIKVFPQTFLIDQVLSHKLESEVL